MAKEAQYNAADHIPAETAADPYLRPAFSASDRARRLLWNLSRGLLYRPSPRSMHGWRAFLLRCFGATMGRNCHFYPASKVWAPWNLVCADQVTAADGAEIYNPATMRFGSHVILPQDAMEFGAYAWVCARASVGPGVNMGEGAVLGLGSVATRDLEPWGVYAGVPAVKIKDRKSSR